MRRGRRAAAARRGGSPCVALRNCPTCARQGELMRHEPPPRSSDDPPRRRLALLSRQLLGLVTQPAATHSGAANVPALLGDYADLYCRGVYDVMHMIRVREIHKVRT